MTDGFDLSVQYTQHTSMDLNPAFRWQHNVRAAGRARVCVIVFSPRVTRN